MNPSPPLPHPAKHNGRLMLALVVGLLMLPFAIAGSLYFFGWQPSRAPHHGQLLEPPQPLPETILGATADYRGKWLFLLRVPGACGIECTSRLDEMRRIQVALYKNMSRLRRGVLTDTPNDPALAALRGIEPDLLIVGTSQDQLSAITSALVLIDPLGQQVMTYTQTADAKGMRADLERLLKYAWTG